MVKSVPLGSARGPFELASGGAHEERRDSPRLVALHLRLQQSACWAPLSVHRHYTVPFSGLRVPFTGLPSLPAPSKCILGPLGRNLSSSLMHFRYPGQDCWYPSEVPRASPPAASGRRVRTRARSPPTLSRQSPAERESARARAACDGAWLERARRRMCARERVRSCVRTLLRVRKKLVCACAGPLGDRSETSLFSRFLLFWSLVFFGFLWF